jgi:hypothetical protein
VAGRGVGRVGAAAGAGKTGRGTGARLSEQPHPQLFTLYKISNPSIEHHCRACCCRRKGNLDARSAAKLENKKAKREKKLLRAGFEGRKAGFINTGKK